MSDDKQETLIALTADIVSAHVGNNSVPVNDLPLLIANVHGALAGLAGGAAAATAEADKPVAAVSVRKSTANPAHILSMIDGKPYKSLKRHITRHGYTVESYRAAFGLPDSYSMVAPEYSEHRRKVAMSLGLGRKAGQKAPAKPAAKASTAPAADEAVAKPAAAKAPRKPRTLKAAISNAKSHLGS